MIIGYLYASSNKECNANPLHAKAVFWAAVDKFQKAKEVDPSMASKANEMIKKTTSIKKEIEDEIIEKTDKEIKKREKAKAKKEKKEPKEETVYEFEYDETDDENKDENEEDD